MEELEQYREEARSIVRGILDGWERELIASMGIPLGMMEDNRGFGHSATEHRMLMGSREWRD